MKMKSKVSVLDANARSHFQTYKLMKKSRRASLLKKEMSFQYADDKGQILYAQKYHLKQLYTKTQKNFQRAKEKQIKKIYSQERISRHDRRGPAQRRISDTSLQLRSSDDRLGSSELGSKVKFNPVVETSMKNFKKSQFSFNSIYNQKKKRNPRFRNTLSEKKNVKQ